MTKTKTEPKRFTDEEPTGDFLWVFSPNSVLPSDMERYRIFKALYGVPTGSRWKERRS